MCEKAGQTDRARIESATTPVPASLDLAIRWRLTRRSVREHLPRSMDPDRPEDVALEWRFRHDGRLCRARALLLDPCTGESIGLFGSGGGFAPAHGSWIGPDPTGRHPDAIEHVDLPGLVSVSFRRVPRVGLSPDAVLLYARTTLLARLGIAGGRYILQGARLGEGPHLGEWDSTPPRPVGT